MKSSYMKKVLLCSIFVSTFAWLAVISPAASYADGPEQTAGAWVTGFINARAGDHLTFTLQIEPRFSLSSQNVERMHLRPGVSLSLPHGISIAGGVTWFHLYQPSADRNDETQVWQDVQHRVDLGELRLTNRFRLEERFLEGRSGTALRLRYLLRGQLHLESEGLSLVAWNELFMNLNSINMGAHSGFDRNRTFLGVNQAVTQAFMVEFGYMLEYANNPGGTDHMNHIIALSSSYTF